MKISNTYRFDAAQERVWDALLDPEVVRDCIPGVQDMQIVTPDSYRVEVGVKVGVFSGSLTGTLEIFDKQPMSSYRMSVRGAGPMTNLTGDALVSLSADGDATTVTVDGDVMVTGALARVGQRFMSSAAKSQFDDFFERLSERVEGH
ncbi:MAG: carbon monoxide dehydrogenase subunit G [Chloroflexota bacterium]|nr:carbon monoxide dehydrogenase subunit G [Chloroflexota bacterium]MDE2942262.1 carbon monoxide dehydrogenase subunit G [Chloroflexota bacterium]MDE3267750.1 carbon monoxide dehydrogenase subunit G [Chloroflexota bacterium]